MARLKISVPVPANFKFCHCCKLVLPLTDFNKDRQRPDGLRTYDRLCDTAKAKASQQRRRDLNAAGKRMTEPHRVTPAERDAVDAAFLAVMVETPEAHAARIGTAKAAKPAKAPRARKPRGYPPGCCAMFPTPADAAMWHKVCGNRG